MSTYGEIQTEFGDLLNRRDSTAAQRKSFLQSGLKKIQRKLRIPAMEKSIVATIGNLYSGGLIVPGDQLELISITDVDEARELTRRALPEVIAQIKHNDGDPLIFARRGSKYVIGPTPAAGKRLQIDYYAEFAPLVNDEDENLLTSLAKDLIIYAGLIYAADHFIDKRGSLWEKLYTDIFTDLMAQGDDDELTGNAQVSPAFRFDLDDC